MLKYIFSFCWISMIIVSVYGGPRVPSSYEFAGIKLTITEGARKGIQKDVDMLHRNQTYLKRKIEKTDLYFPIIERVFKEEGLPDDFKYLVIQESALIADAVSTSNAVGFWQFKEASAKEVGLRVDRYIDERMHITAASRGAAKYLKKNNFFFDNWVYALLAYNTGPGGAEQHVEKKYFGKKKMEITRKTHWYVKKFLAHKIAFENEIHKNYAPGLRLYEYEKTQNRTLKELAAYFEIDFQAITDYNKWLKRGRIPDDKTYLAIIPVGPNNLLAQDMLNTKKKDPSAVKPQSKMVFKNAYKPISDFDFNKNEDYPKISSGSSSQIKINGIPGFIASSTENIATVTAKYGISKSKFLKFNDLTAVDEVDDGHVYYLKPKKSKAKIHYHIVIPGENAWSISQKYGIKIKKLLAKNRMREEKDLSPGMVMWLRFIRPANIPVEYREIDVQNVVVKSIPNEIAYPTSGVDEPEEAEANNVTDEIEEASTTSEDDFLFEEVNEDTEFISENSFLDLNAGPEEIHENTGLQATIDVKKENVEKSELYHIVKSGETLFSISRTYEVSIGELRQWNDIDDLDVLHVGQQLLIKDGKESAYGASNPPASGQYKTYIVKDEDTLYSIARKHGISIKELMELNNKEDFIIKEGEILKIKQSR